MWKNETMLDQLIERPIQSGDMLSNANTVILMGKTRKDDQIGRAFNPHEFPPIHRFFNPNAELLAHICVCVGCKCHCQFVLGDEFIM